jgi:adenylyl-sulfate kinase
VSGPPPTDAIRWSPSLVSVRERQRLLGQTGGVVWLTGLSGSGKSTISRRLEQCLIASGRAAYVLDGDNIRHGLCRDLGFAPADRTENIRRIGAVAQLFADAGLVAIAAFISPYRADRDLARRACSEHPFIEVHLSTPLACCEARDPKGLYARARAGALSGFTGIDAPYEEPEQPELRLDTSACGVDESVARILALLHAKRILSPPATVKEVPHAP